MTSLKFLQGTYWIMFAAFKHHKLTTGILVNVSKYKRVMVLFIQPWSETHSFSTHISRHNKKIFMCGTYGPHVRW